MWFLRLFFWKSFTFAILAYHIFMRFHGGTVMACLKISLPLKIKNKINGKWRSWEVGKEKCSEYGYSGFSHSLPYPYPSLEGFPNLLGPSANEKHREAPPLSTVRRRSSHSSTNPKSSSQCALSLSDLPSPSAFRFYDSFPAFLAAATAVFAAAPVSRQFVLAGGVCVAFW